MNPPASIVVFRTELSEPKHKKRDQYEHLEGLWDEQSTDDIVTGKNYIVIKGSGCIQIDRSATGQATLKLATRSCRNAGKLGHLNISFS